MNFRHEEFRYPSKRYCMYANRGMVGSSSPLAAQAGLEILKQGGNAIDAAIATAAALTVVEPYANGIGGDLFSIFYKDGEMYGINSSGRAPETMTADVLKAKGYEKEIPQSGFGSITVPGLPAGWAKMVEDFGNLTLEEVVEPAAKIAEEGYVFSAMSEKSFKRSYDRYSSEIEQHPELKTWFDMYTRDGRTLKAGEIFVAKETARALRSIGKTNAASFYTGEIADAIEKLSNEYNGCIKKSDLAKHKAEMVEPISTNYRGVDVWEIPPNGIGIIALMGLNNLENFKLGEKESVDTYHKQIESLKLAFSDGKEHIADIDYMNVGIESMLSKHYAKERASLIGIDALQPAPGEIPGAGTVYLAAADKDGNMVSLIQSCFTGFGSGVIVPEWGINLHSRGSQFSLDEHSPNLVEPNKKPYHTIIPGFLSKDGKALGPFGIMGGPMQPQAHLQVISNLVDFNLNPQDALNAPRWQWVKDKEVMVEPEMPQYIIDGLIKRGHKVSVSADHFPFGRGQIILKQDNNSYVGGTEPRTDGHMAVW